MNLLNPENNFRFVADGAQSGGTGEKGDTELPGKDYDPNALLDIRSIDPTQSESAQGLDAIDLEFINLFVDLYNQIVTKLSTYLNSQVACFEKHPKLMPFALEYAKYELIEILAYTIPEIMDERTDFHIKRTARSLNNYIPTLFGIPESDQLKLNLAKFEAEAKRLASDDTLVDDEYNYFRSKVNKDSSQYYIQGIVEAKFNEIAELIRKFLIESMSAILLKEILIRSTSLSEKYTSVKG